MAFLPEFLSALLWRHNEHDSVSNHQPHDCLLNRLFRRRSKKTSKPRVTGLCVGNSPGTGEFPAQMASNAENVSIWWRHHGPNEAWYEDDLMGHGAMEPQCLNKATNTRVWFCIMVNGEPNIFD